MAIVGLMNMVPTLGRAMGAGASPFAGGSLLASAPAWGGSFGNLAGIDQLEAMLASMMGGVSPTGSQFSPSFGSPTYGGSGGSSGGGISPVFSGNSGNFSSGASSPASSANSGFHSAAAASRNYSSAPTSNDFGQLNPATAPAQLDGYSSKYDGLISEAAAK